MFGFLNASDSPLPQKTAPAQPRTEGDAESPVWNAVAWIVDCIWAVGAFASEIAWFISGLIALTALIYGIYLG